MASRGLSAFVIIAAASGMNAIRTVQTGKDPFPGLLAGVVLGTVAVGVDDASNTNIGTMFAVVFFLGSFIMHGQPLIETVVAATGSPKFDVSQSPVTPGNTPGYGLHGKT